MALVGRSPVKLAATPSNGPNEAMVASLQAHIDDLVQKNRTCEYEKRKLQQLLEREKERGEEHARRANSVVQREREEWKEGCDSLLASHRIVHLRTLIELDKTREEVLREKEGGRKERLEVLNRDFRLSLFQAKELELEMKVSALEEALESLVDQHDVEATNYVSKYEGRVIQLQGSLQRAVEDNQEMTSRMASLDAELSKCKVCYRAILTLAHIYPHPARKSFRKYVSNIRHYPQSMVPVRPVWRG